MISKFYSNNNFDRATLERESKTLKALAQTKKYIPIWNDHFLYNWDTGKVQFYKKIPCNWETVLTNRVFLGVYNDIEYYCIDISQSQEPKEINVVLLEIRQLFSVLNNMETALLAYANGIIKWHNMHSYCGICGKKTKSDKKGHIRVCVNNHCKKIHYPRIDPAIITLIEYKQKNKPSLCLLNRNETEKGFKCSPFAGFVEIGERLEDAVIREMKEEVNVEVHNIKYISSQPWPFPSAIMIGFLAQAKTLKFKIDNKEIKDAKWYSALEIHTEVKKGTLELSNEDSIARTLIEYWVSKQLTNRN